MIRRWLFPFPQVSVSAPLTPTQVGRLTTAALARHASRVAAS